jgi:hypothetical protein
MHEVQPSEISMTGKIVFLWTSIHIMIVAAICVLAVACSSGSEASKGAKQGATTGAVAGAVGGMVTALVFGGNVADAGARGAVAGASSGAVVGGMSGSQRDKQNERQQVADQDARLAELRKKIGDDAFDGTIALAKCNYAVANANADVAMQSGNSNYALAGLWVKVLSSADQRNEPDARARFSEIVAQDKKIKSEAEAEQAMREALQQLMDIRVANNLPKVCPI